MGLPFEAGGPRKSSVVRRPLNGNLNEASQHDTQTSTGQGQRPGVPGVLTDVVTGVPGSVRQQADESSGQGRPQGKKGFYVFEGYKKNF